MTKSPEASSNQDAFEKILTRLKDDVGNIIELIKTEKAKGEGNRWSNTAPFWAVARLLFPIAEAVGFLIHGEAHTRNLIEVIENEFESVRPGYNGKAETIAKLFRHSLTHTDVLFQVTTRDP
jgi:hypothetical protein